MLETKPFVKAGLACVATLAYAATSSAGLVHHWTFDSADVSGTGTAGDPWVAADVVGSADVSTPATDGGSSMAPAAGIIGEAFSFTRDSVGTSGNSTTAGIRSEFENGLLTSVTGVAPSGNAERTISIWFNQGTSSGGHNRLFGYGSNNVDSDATTGDAFDVSLEGGGIRLRTFSGNVTYGSGFDFQPGGADEGWHHVAVRVNAGATTFNDVDVFLDGVILTGVSTGGDALNDTIATVDGFFGIGNNGYDFILNNNYTGLLDEVRVYDNAITDQEIAALAVPEPGSVALLAIGGLLAARRRRG